MVNADWRVSFFVFHLSSCQCRHSDFRAAVFDDEYSQRTSKSSTSFGDKMHTHFNLLLLKCLHVLRGLHLHERRRRFVAIHTEWQNLFWRFYALAMTLFAYFGRISFADKKWEREKKKVTESEKKRDDCCSRSVTWWKPYLFFVFLSHSASVATCNLS